MAASTTGLRKQRSTIEGQKPPAGGQPPVGDSSFGCWSFAIAIAFSVGYWLIAASFPVSSHAQSSNYGLGRTATAEEIHQLDLSISPTGEGLPPGSGNATVGAQLFVQKGCAGCHGATGSGGLAPTLIKSEGKPKSKAPCLSPCINDNNVMALHAPYATVLWDFIRRGMPLGHEGTLKPDEVYSLVAFLLYKNGVIQEDEVLDAQSLPKVKMPNRNGFVEPPDWKPGQPRLQGYP